ncbi:MAG TPA: SOS response-associated peptidase family protein [Rhodoferax sp.]|mgnify:CR=1 FL=1|nr:SOS response-associated peptidase family protein [Rhodoferax sp.]
MCNLYEPSKPEQISLDFGVQLPLGDYAGTIAPFKPGPFVRASGAVVGQWGMIPAMSRTRKPVLPNGRPLSTNNTRRERMATAPTYRDAWKRGQRCLIPAVSFDEPYWGTGKNIWWRFWRADGAPWALAGIWSEWTDPETGEVVPNYSMITQNCDAHPLLSLMHKPDSKLPSDQQDKRAVVPIERADWDAWLNGTLKQAEALIRVPDLAMFRHAAADPGKQVALPIAMGL